jgi:hypothetical protein
MVGRNAVSKRIGEVVGGKEAGGILRLFHSTKMRDEDGIP